jgi:DNA-binding MarR family transcriptional regulator
VEGFRIQRRRRNTRSTRSAERIADQLHSAAIHVLRRLRHEDEVTGLSAPRLSALSVIVFAGPITLGRLAAAEGVRPPTMTRLVNALEADGLVTRESDPNDARFTRIRATAKGRSLLATGRTRRVTALARQITGLSAADRAVLTRAAVLMEELASRAEGGGA